MRELLADFRKFITRGNVIDLAVAVVIGTAFTALVTSFVENIVMPIIGIVGGEPSFDDYYVTINDSRIKYGTFLTALVSFVIIALAVFLMIKSFEKLQALRRSKVDAGEEEAELTVSEELLKEIRDLLREGQVGSAPGRMPPPPAPPT